MAQATLVRRRSPSLQRAFGRVGEPEEQFRSRTFLPFALISGGILLLAVAGAAAWWIWPLGVGAPGLAALPAIPFALGIMAIGFGWRVWGERWFVCPGGIVRQHGSTGEACAWADFLSIGQSSDRGTYYLRRKDGPAWEVSSTSTPEISELGRLIRLKAEAHGVKWEAAGR
jgi:hypothetical protein